MLLFAVCAPGLPHTAAAPIGVHQPAALSLVAPVHEIQLAEQEKLTIIDTAPTGGKYDLMKAAGISPSDYNAVDYIISHESSWNVNATEPTYGAHGLPQALPYSKTGCGWVDAVCQLQWADSYAKARYGSWWSAYTYWTINHNW